jgi:Spy/CpxP family protein refolding chaperone
MGGPGGFMGGRFMEHMLDDVKATEAQRTQIRQITQQAATDMRVQRDTRRALHDRAMQVFTAPNVDASAAESIRQEMLAQHDATSRRMLQAMLDVSRVLTPEQRAQLAQRMKERRERMEERMRRHMDGQADRPQPPTQ